MNRRYNPGAGRTHLYPSVGVGWVACRSSVLGGLLYGTGRSPELAWTELERRADLAVKREAAEIADAKAALRRRTQPSARDLSLLQAMAQVPTVDALVFPVLRLFEGGPGPDYPGAGRVDP